MKLLLDNGSATNVIRGYQTGSVTVNELTLTETVIVMPERLVHDWPPRCHADLRRDHFEVLAALGVEIVLLGTGATLRFPHPELTAPLLERHIGLEVMDTAAACRTYNLLMAEGRRVAAALLMR